MANTMSAVAFGGYGEAEVLERFEVPVPLLKHDEVLVRVAAAGINPADWRIRSGQFKRFMKVPLPFVPGADVAGVVAAVGTSVEQFQPGDRVFAMLPAARGGGYAEFAAVTAKDAALIPHSVSFVEAAGVPVAGLTALQALRDQARVQTGARVLIYGASGGVGTYAVQIAKAMGAHVTAACSSYNTALVRSLGADAVVDYTRTDVTTLSERFDVVFDAVNKLSFLKARRLVRKGDVMVTVNPIAGKLVPDFFALLWGGQRLRSLFVQPSGKDLETLGRWMAEGQVRSAVSEIYWLSQAVEAHHRSETGRVSGKLVLVVDEQAVTEIRDSPKTDAHLFTQNPQHAAA